MVSFSSAEPGADHVHGEFECQHHEVDNSDAENYLYASQSFDLRLRNPADTRSGSRHSPD
jgi:hypothetical protein